MTMKATPDGFLAGTPVNAEGEAIDEQTRLLESIGHDTDELVGIARAHLRATARLATAVPAGRSGAAGNWAPRGQPGASGSSLRVATPAGRGSGSTAMPRDAAGRFAARGALAGSSEMRLADYSAAIDRLALVTERQRRDDRADKRAMPDGKRDASGRFVGESLQQGGLLARINAPTIGDGGQMDPLLGAVSEARGLLAKVGAVAVPQSRPSGSNADEPAGLLRRVWRELRAMRKADANTSRTTLARLAALGKAAPGGSSDGGLLDPLAGLLPALPVLLGPLAAVGGGAALALKAAGGLVRRLPVLGALFEGITGVLEDQRIAADTSLSPGQQRQQRAANAGGTLGSIGGVLAGAAAGQALIPIPVVGAVVGAVAGGMLGKKAGQAAGGALGAVSARFESGGAGAGAVSSGKGDFGGASYGTHQLSSKTGTLQKYLGQSAYGAQFAGLEPGTPEFNAKWKQIAASDPKFGQDQKDFIGRTHYEPQMAHLAKAGIDLSGKGDTVKEAVWSTAVQFGGKTDLIKKALAGKDVSKMTDADTIAAIQDYKIANNSSLFKSSSAEVQASTLKRAGEEKKALLALSGQSPTAATATAAAPAGGAVPPIATVAAATAPKPVAIPPMPVAPMPAVIPSAPSIEAAGPQRLDTAPASGAPSAPPAPPAQDVRDRLIAHIATGGIGGFGGIAHR